MSLDRERYRLGLGKNCNIAEEWIDHDVVLSLHPEWLFEEDEKNQQRTNTTMSLKTVLKVDQEFETLSVKKKLFFKIAHDINEYEKNINPSRRIH